jgi:hypothetical protein
MSSATRGSSKQHGTADPSYQGDDNVTTETLFRDVCAARFGSGCLATHPRHERSLSQEQIDRSLALNPGKLKGRNLLVVIETLPAEEWRQMRSRLRRFARIDAASRGRSVAGAVVLGLGLDYMLAGPSFAERRGGNAREHMLPKGSYSQVLLPPRVPRIRPQVISTMLDVFLSQLSQSAARASRMHFCPGRGWCRTWADSASPSTRTRPAGPGRAYDCLLRKPNVCPVLAVAAACMGIEVRIPTLAVYA